MEAFLLNSLLPPKPSIQGLCCRKFGQPLRKRLCGRRVIAKAIGPQGRDYEEGHSVDESMIVLRKRIYELKLSEEGFGMDAQLPHEDHWMEWEKQYKTSSAYDSDVYEAVGLLQTMLMNTRPSLAIGIVALVLLSVSTSLGMILLGLAQAASRIFHGF